MKLYHGTTEKAARQILAGAGIRPRGKKKGNWQHTIESHPECVYLTTAYAPYFALSATTTDERVAVLEIDTKLLNPFALLPDEDFLGQVVKAREDYPALGLPEGWNGWDIMKKTRWFRRHLDAFQSNWRLSVEKLGTCCFKGTVPTSAVTRLATWRPGETPHLSFMSLDPTISVMNYRFVGNKYRGVLKWLFGDDLGEDAPVEQFINADPEEIVAKTQWSPEMLEAMRWSYHLPPDTERAAITLETLRISASDAA